MTAEAMAKEQAEKKEAEEQLIDKAFLAEFTELALKHNRDIGAKLNYTERGLIPTPVVIRKEKKEESKVISSPTEAVEPKKVEEAVK